MDPQLEALLQTAFPNSCNSELIRLQEQAKKDMNRMRYANYPGQGAYKISFASTEPESVRKAGVALSDRFDFIVHPSKKYSGCLNGEIIRKGIDKKRGMEIVHQHLGIELRNTVAFGDSMNDYSMLCCTGISVAMGNACEEIKAICDRVCEDVAHDGVYWEFMRMGLCSEPQSS